MPFADQAINHGLPSISEIKLPGTECEGINRPYLESMDKKNGHREVLCTSKSVNREQDHAHQEESPDSNQLNPKTDNATFSRYNYFLHGYYCTKTEHTLQDMPCIWQY